MKVTPARVHGAFVIDPVVNADARGTFVELFQSRAIAAQGGTGTFVRSVLSHNTRAYTLRGLHFQRAPHQDAKLVTCVAGSVFDVIADIRPDSPSRGAWDAVELSAANRRSLFIPEGVAHGFQTLVDETTLLYHIGAYYAPEAGGGIRYDDPQLGIEWPQPPSIISQQDASFPFWQS